MKTLLKNGRILDPSQDLDFIGCVLLEDHQIVEIAEQINPIDIDEVFDCEGLWIAPGLVDMHMHLRQPGGDHQETIASGTSAAAAGGYTTVCCMPNTNPRLDNAGAILHVNELATSFGTSGVFVAPVGAIVCESEPNKLANFSSMKRVGIVAVSDESRPIEDALLMTRAMQICAQLQLPLLLHCEDPKLSQSGTMNEGATSALLGLAGIPRTAEEIATMRNCILALHHNCPIHVMRVSTWGAVETIRLIRTLGAPVTCEVSPLHLIFTDENIGEFDSRFKMIPPLRTQVDVDLLIQGLQDGTIDCIASDHSPHAAYEVEVPFEDAAFGASTIEATLALILTHITHKNLLSPLETIRKLSTRPAEILGLDAGTLQPGMATVAQITVINPHHRWHFDRKKMVSKGKNVPFDGMALEGKVMLTFVGTEIYRAPEFKEERYTIIG